MLYGLLGIVFFKPLKTNPNPDVMSIKIHRGLDQIGGSITEISTATSRVFIDMGKNLPGSGEQMTNEEEREYVAKLFSQNKKENEAVVYTHAHEDHVGMFVHVPENVPQYIGEGGLELLLAKYRTLLKAPLNAEEVACVKEKIRRLETFHVWERPRRPKAFSIGDIAITPFYCNHSIYDSYMLLIEADGKRIWHTGDYREHGFLGKGLVKVLKVYAKDIDVLITEGTNLKKPEKCIHESVVSSKMACIMQAFKYVFVLASSTDIDRLAAIKKASKSAHKNLYINSAYMKEMMRIFTEREAGVADGLYEFQPIFATERSLDKMKRYGFVLVTGVTKYADVELMRMHLPDNETVLIYSSWDGYYKIPEQVEVNPMYKMFRDSFNNVVDIHTSGHADRETIKKVIEIVNPKDEVIVIHKEADASWS